MTRIMVILVVRDGFSTTLRHTEPLKYWNKRRDYTRRGYSR